MSPRPRWGVIGIGKSPQFRAWIHRVVFDGDGEGRQPATDACRHLMADIQYRTELDWIVGDAHGMPAA